MRRILLTVTFLFAALLMSAQSDRYEQRYDLLVSQFGPAGVGVETVLDNWAKVDSTNVRMLVGRFSYLFTKSKTSVVEKKEGRRYLGMEPLITLKDSTGKDVNYYQISVFDDDLYGEAIKAADKAVSFHPDRLELRFMKVNAYIEYEKESPDMALAGLIALVNENGRRKSSWTYEGEAADQNFFQDAMQEYCYSFYTIASTASYEAFRILSEKLAETFPDNMDYLCNIGSYHMVVKGNCKTALKYYNKVLKVQPDNITALRNAVIAARRMKNVKLEKKYMDKYSQSKLESSK